MPHRTCLRTYFFKNIFPQPVRTHIRGINCTFGIGHNAGCAGDTVHVRSGQVRVRYEGPNRAVFAASPCGGGRAHVLPSMSQSRLETSGLSLRHRYHAGNRLRTSEYFH